MNDTDECMVCGHVREEHCPTPLGESYCLVCDECDQFEKKDEDE